jgi:hypothetical protein
VGCVAPRARPTVRQRSVPVPARGHLQATERDGNETPCANRQHSHFIASLFTPDRKNTEQSLCFCTLDFSILPERANRITPFVSIVRLRTCLVQYTGRRILSSTLLHPSENSLLSRTTFLFIYFLVKDILLDRLRPSTWGLESNESSSCSCGSPVAVWGELLRSVLRPVVPFAVHRMLY